MRKVSDIDVAIGKYSSVIDAWVLDMGQLDLVLGIAWLRTLAEVTIDWVTMNIRFQNKGEEVQARFIEVFQEPIISLRNFDPAINFLPGKGPVSFYPLYMPSATQWWNPKICPVPVAKSNYWEQ